ncbi:DUF2141 domain-containing protein [Candidatus Nitrosacidococcus tergens]|uniref:DUF2141 domain-containing protein n=1 Tax=Candidatus Nitrosacidococcus tergens TaxID=553981 RepID=A0A7G1QAK5_9GAMM|nr:DUF2141 domain-containing protein [Candidatus Nitrosacidococcus tergens]CAB1276543.1 protein of unknown function [Candidatus Nitrosacidococcus tergens]
MNILRTRLQFILCIFFILSLFTIKVVWATQHEKCCDASKANTPELSQLKEGEGATFEIKINRIDPKTGHIRIAIYNDPENWLKKPVYAAILSAEDTDEVEWTIHNIPPGSYALACFHDRDMSGDFYMGILGINRERYCFSHNVQAFFGPPHWDQTKFDVEDHMIKEFNIRLR